MWLCPECWLTALTVRMECDVVYGIAAVILHRLSSGFCRFVYLWIAASNFSRSVSLKAKSEAAKRRWGQVQPQSLCKCLLCVPYTVKTNTHKHTRRVWLAAGVCVSTSAHFTALYFIAFKPPKASRAAANYRHLTWPPPLNQSTWKSPPSVERIAELSRRPVTTLLLKRGGLFLQLSHPR